MKISIPCECEAEEHEEYVDVETNFGHTGYNGIGIGDKLPCGREVTQEDVDRIFEAIDSYNVREDL